LPGRRSEAGGVGNVKSIGSPFMDKGRLRVFLRETAKIAGD
jgi:hypothetical protein